MVKIHPVVTEKIKISFIFGKIAVVLVVVVIVVVVVVIVVVVVVTLVVPSQIFRYSLSKQGLHSMAEPLFLFGSTFVR